MSDNEQALCMLRQFLAARKLTPWIAVWFEFYGAKDSTGWNLPAMCLHRMGGLEAVW